MKGFRLVLAVLVALVVLGSGVAVAQQDDSGSGSSEAPSEATIAPNGEIPADRTASSRTFELPGDKLETRLYQAPVNYAAAGGWRPIGERFHLEGSAVTNGANDLDVSLPKQIDVEPARVSVGDSWVASEMTSAEAEPVQLEGDTATYDAANATVSFNYTGLSNGLKEDIELASLADPSTFSFELSAASGLTPSLEEGGAVAFRDEHGDLVALLPPPVMSDSAGTESRAVRYELGEESEGHWTLMLRADPQWLAQPQRSFPVAIDPTITTGPPYGCVIGGHKGETGWIDCASWGRTTFLTGYTPKLNSAEDNWWRTLMNFETEAVPPTAEVSSAIFRIRSTETAQNTKGVELRKVTKPWTWQASWSRYDGPEHLWSTEGGDYSELLGEVLTANRGNQAGWWEFSLPTKTVEEEAAEGEQLKVMMKLIDDKVRECGKTSCTNRQITFDSSAAKTEANRPYLSVVYTMPSSETPIAEYSFNEGSGELAKDGSGHGHDGTLHGAKWTSEGHFAGALSFDGNKAIVTVPSAKELELSRALTLEAWVKPDEANAWSAVFTKETPEFLSYQLHAEAEGESPAGFLFGNEEEEAAVEGTSPIATKAWSYLALTSDGEYMRLYVGGKLVGTSAAVQGRGGKGPLQIGNDLPWEGDGFKGAIDNIRLYNRTLSGAEIEKDESRAVGIKAPTATSEAATGISATEATLKASVNPNGTATTYQFEYGTTTSYGTKAPTSPESAGSGSTAVALSKAISGLKEATTYHFRVLATSEGATSYGEDKTFTTLVLPSATTEAATGVNEHEATLKGSVNPNGTATSYQFEYGSTTSYGTKVPSSPEPIGNGTANINVGQQIKSLENNHVYHYRIVAISGAGTSYGGDRFLRVDFTPPTSKFESNYQDGSTSTYTLTMHTVDPGSQSAGVKQINFLLNGKVVETFEPSCAENQCPTVTEATWEHSFDHHLTGEDHLTVLTVDAASNNSSTTFDLPSQIAQASVYTGNPAEGGTQLAEEWSQPYTHDARLEEGTRTVTRGSSVCPEPEADKWCSYLRTNTAGEFSEVNAQISEPTTISEAGTLSIPHQADFGKTVETGTTSEIVQPWQTLPRGAGTGYEKIVSENEANQAEGQYLEMAGRWTFWVDAATKLPLKASVSEGTTEPRTAYYSYSSANLEAGELSSSFFLLKPPSRQERGCVASGQLGGWTYNEAGFTNPDPRFDSVINTVNGPLVLRPEGAAADGYEPRAILTEDGIELAANSTDEDRLRWEVTESAEQSLEPAGSAVVVVSEAGVPSAVVESSSSDDVEIVDGDPNVEQNRSGDEVVLEPMEGGTTASLHPVQSPDDQLPCITHPILAQAEMVHEEAVAAGVVMQKPESSKSETTQVKIWINPHPALSGVSITDKYGACNGPNPKTVGSDGYVIFGGCPVGKDTTFTVPAEVNANGLIYRVSDPSRTMKPPSYGWTVSFDYRGESPPGEPPAEEQLPEATELRIGLGEYESNGSEAEVSAEEPINIPPQYDCYAAQSRPWRAESAIPNKFRARAEMIFRCNADAFIDSWWFKWHLSRWDQETGQWKHRAAAEPEGRGPAVQNQGPYYIGTECRSLTNLLKEPEKLWRSEGKAWALAERPGGALFGLGPSFGATKGKKLHCE